MSPGDETKDRGAVALLGLSDLTYNAHGGNDLQYRVHSNPSPMPGGTSTYSSREEAISLIINKATQREILPTSFSFASRGGVGIITAPASAAARLALSSSTVVSLRSPTASMYVLNEEDDGRIEGWKRRAHMIRRRQPSGQRKSGVLTHRGHMKTSEEEYTMTAENMVIGG